MSAITRLCRDFSDGLSLRWRHLRLGRAGAAEAAQERSFRDLLKAVVQTEFGRRHGFAPDMAWRRFQAAAPLGSATLGFEERARLRNGGGWSWPGACTGFVREVSADGVAPGCLPLTAEFERHYRRAWREALLMLANRETGNGCLRAPVAAFSNLADDQAGCETLVQLIGRLARGGGGVSEDLLALWTEGDRDHALGSAMRSVRWLVSLAPVYPLDACGMAETFGESCVVHEVAATPAGLFGAQDRVKTGQGLRLFADSGLFFEFLSLADYASGRLAALGERTLRLAEVKPGVDYVLIVSAPSGLFRYCTGEVVRFLSVSPPRLLRMGRASRVLNLAGENVPERTLVESLFSVCRERGWSLMHVHVAPHRRPTLTGQRRDCHEWWLELRPGSRQTPTGAMIGPLIDESLCRLHAAYAEARKGGRLGEPMVRLVIPGVFQALLERNASTGRQAMLPLSQADRVVADALAGLVRFHDA